MRMTQGFGQTLREAPADAQTAGQQLLFRSGYIRSAGAGEYCFLPFGLRIVNKIAQQWCDLFTSLNGQEIRLPASGSRVGVLRDLLHTEVHSYKHLPLHLFHVQRRQRENFRQRLGLLQARDYAVAEMLVFAPSYGYLETALTKIKAAAVDIFGSLGLPVVLAETFAAEDWEGKDDATQAFVYFTEAGEDTFLVCDTCGYTANQKAARMHKSHTETGQPAALERVRTPECKTIEALAQFLDIPKAQTAKAVFLVASAPARKIKEGNQEDVFVFAILRGDMGLNETKLARCLGGALLRPATEEEIGAVGAVPGYASPVGLKQTQAKPMNVQIVVDDLIPHAPNLVAGANEEGYHLRNVTYGRDYQAHIIADIALCQDGDGCPQCGARLGAVQGVETGWLYCLDLRNGNLTTCTFQDEEGNEQPILSGVCGVELDRMMGCMAEAGRDEAGLVLPAAAAPFDVHLIYLPDKKERVPLEVAERLYVDLQKAGVSVLFDDRDERPGVKFNDADLLGLPLRLTVSARSLAAGGVEVKQRQRPEKELLSYEETLHRCVEAGK